MTRARRTLLLAASPTAIDLGVSEGMNPAVTSVTVTGTFAPGADAVDGHETEGHDGFTIAP